MDQLDCSAQWESVLRRSPEGSGRQLHSDLLNLHVHLRDQMREKCGRSVPLADELTDRWERARFLGFGKGTSIYDSALVLGDVRVAENTWIGPQCVLDGSGGLEIGSSCSIATGCQIYSHDSVEWALSGGKAPYRRRPTRVGNSCYLGPGAIVAAGSTIGDHCLIGALSLVKDVIPPHSIALGIPAKVVGRVVIHGDARVELHYDNGRVVNFAEDAAQVMPPSSVP